MKEASTICMKIAIGSDERTPLTDAIMAELRRRGHELIPFGPLAVEVTSDERRLLSSDEMTSSESTLSPFLPSPPASPWPSVARAVAEAVAGGAADEGILFCWTGTGVSLAANKVPGIRAALCADAETARGARLWNNANVLCLSLRLTSEVVAKEILDMWFNTSFVPNDTDNACLALLAALEAAYGGGEGEKG